MVLSTGALGVFLGAQIAEGVLFVPYWKSLAAADYYKFHRALGKKIYQFFAPLTIIATIIPLSAVAYGIATNGFEQLSLILMGVFTVIFFSTYYLYFKKANHQFTEETVTPEDLPAALKKWGHWHWTRIIFEALAFICAMLILIEL